ncbi:MAG TPA: S9 family peptidase [Longimicrobiales bacterium]|nr:S9 family peptidase [Longimicrobiales bacterium]
MGYKHRPGSRGTVAAILFSAAVLAAPAHLQAQDAPRPMVPEDAFRLRSVGSPALSPDGEWVAYTVSTTDLEEEKRETRLWMVPAAGGEAIPMTRSGESVGSPAWSPDGRYLSFTATRGEDAKSQVWVLDRRGGEAWALTDEKQGVSSYEWSPDGSKLLLVMRDEEVKDSTWTSDEKEPWVIDRLQIKRDGVGYLTDPRKNHLYVFDVATRTTRQITAGGYDEGSPAWSPDGKWVVFSSNRTADPDANSDSNLWIVATEVEEPVTEPRQLTTYPGGDGSPAFSPDGRWIAYTTGTTDPQFSAFGTSHLAVIPVEGGEAAERRILTESLDRNVRQPVWDRDGRGVVFSVADEGETHVARVDVETGQVERLVGGEIDAGSFHVGKDGRVAAVISRPHLPGELFVTERPVATAMADRMALVEGARTGGRDLQRLRKLTAVNDSLVSALALAEVRNIHVPSTEGATIEGWIYTPAGWDGETRLPTLLRIHGGPNGMYGVGFSTEAQLLAANGYAVVMMNPRGSSGYGFDFGMALWQRWGVPDVEDVLAGVNEAVAQGIADPDRLGVGGWSYGGILTNYLITKRPDVFKGAITGASMVLLVANFGHDHYQLGNEREWGLPWENREMWERLSPFNDVDKVETPTLIMGGESDWNVPIQNSEQLYQALRRRGVPTQLVVYPGQPHGLRPAAYQLDRYKRYIEWYDKWVKEGAGKPVT